MQTNQQILRIITLREAANFAWMIYQSYCRRSESELLKKDFLGEPEAAQEVTGLYLTGRIIAESKLTIGDSDDEIDWSEATVTHYFGAAMIALIARMVTLLAKSGVHPHAFEELDLVSAADASFAEEEYAACEKRAIANVKMYTQKIGTFEEVSALVKEGPTFFRNERVVAQHAGSDLIGYEIDSFVPTELFSVDEIEDCMYWIASEAVKPRERKRI